MRAPHAITLDGTETMIDGAEVAAFKQCLRGDLLCPEDAGYESARRVWNGMIDKRPRPDRPLHGGCRRRAGGHLRPYPRYARGDPLWEPQRRRPCNL